MHVMLKETIIITLLITSHSKTSHIQELPTLMRELFTW